MSRPLSLEGLRKRIASLQAEREALTTQRRSRSEIAAQLSATIDGWAGSGAEQILQDLQRLAAGQACEPLTMRGPVLNMGPLLCAMLGADHVRGVVLAQLEAIPEGLPTSERLARIREIESSLDDLEKAEEQMVVESGAERRPNCRPEIVLVC